ncbi:MAG: hypothetical protein ACRDD1_08415, partial [Planctomycetia bacterium]
VEYGKTRPGEIDHNDLQLGLDRVNTGFELNGFAGDRLDSHTLSWNANSGDWMAPAMLDALLMDLNSDSRLVGSILKTDADKNCLNLYSFFNATLRLTGMTAAEPAPVPEPTACLIWGLGAAGLAWRNSRSRRRAGTAS